MYEPLYTQAEGLLTDITKLQDLASTMQTGGTPEVTFIRTAVTTVTGLWLSLTKEGTSNVQQITPQQIHELSKEGNIVAGLDTKKYFSEIEKASQSTLKKFENKILTATEGKDRVAAKERYDAEVQYQALKIQLVYKVAKMVQGGSGGQAVSNADFQAVLASFQGGSFGTLSGEQAVFSLLHKMTEKEYLYTSIMADSSIHFNARDSARTAVALYKQYDVGSYSKQINNSAGELGVQVPILTRQQREDRQRISDYKKDKYGSVKERKEE